MTEEEDEEDEEVPNGASLNFAPNFAFPPKSDHRQHHHQHHYHRNHHKTASESHLAALKPQGCNSIGFGVWLRDKFSDN